jgi:hypothetical protein
MAFLPNYPGIFSDILSFCGCASFECLIPVQKKPREEAANWAINVVPFPQIGVVRREGRVVKGKWRRQGLCYTKRDEQQKNPSPILRAH